LSSIWITYDRISRGLGARGTEDHTSPGFIHRLKNAIPKIRAKTTQIAQETKTEKDKAPHINRYAVFCA
jgi:hypothetical protein